MTHNNTFAAGSAPWLSRLDNLRNVVRQEVVSRQVAAHRPADGSGCRAVDVGAGQGTQAVLLARVGFEVTAVEPEQRMRDACRTALASEPAGVRGRVRLVAGQIGNLPDDVVRDRYDVVLCHGVLMYLDSPDAALSQLAQLAAPDGIVSVLTRNAEAMAWRPASRHDWRSALVMLDEVERAGREKVSPTYRNEIGVEARADHRDQLVDLLRAKGVEPEAWYGVRIASDSVRDDEPFPSDPEQARALLDLEERLGRTDPYRRMGSLMHLVGRSAPSDVRQRG